MSNVRAEATRLATDLVDELNGATREEQVAALRGLLLGTRDGALEHAALVCDRNGEEGSAAEIRSLKVGRE